MTGVGDEVQHDQIASADRGLRITARSAPASSGHVSTNCSRCAPSRQTALRQLPYDYRPPMAARLTPAPMIASVDALALPESGRHADTAAVRAR